MPQLSILDLAPIVRGGDVKTALERSLELAQHAEQCGVHRFWVAEHHNMPGVASAATAVVLGHIAAGTRSIRVGAGGIMLPNHAPLVIAEQFGTLGSLFPGRIDLGLGRALGTDALTARALRRPLQGSVDTFPADVEELLEYFRPPSPDARVVAVPGAGVDVPVWILGSSLFGAALAARLGLPFGFASHFAPGRMMEAIELYRRDFQPSPRCERPYVMLGANVIVADTDDEARYLLSSLQQVFVQLQRGRPGPLPPPVAEFENRLSWPERLALQETLACTWAGSPATVGPALRAFLAKTNADELIVSVHVYDQAARLRSVTLTAELFGALTARA